MTDNPNPATAAYRRADAPLTGLVADLPPAAWDAPSPCDSWTARDVLAHLIDTQRDLLGDHGADLGPRPDLSFDPAAAWSAHRDAALAALDDGELVARGFDGHFGPTTVGETVERFHVFDMVVHRWDIARSAGIDARFSDDELDRLEVGIAGFGPALHMEGVCRPGVEAPDGGDRQARVLAVLGRRG